MSRVLSVLPHFIKSTPSCLHCPCHVRPSNFFLGLKLERAPWSPSQHVCLPIPFPFHAVCKSFLSGVRWDHNSQAVWFGASCRTLPSSVTCTQELPCVVSVCFSWCSLAHRLPTPCFPGSDLNGPVESLVPWPQAAFSQWGEHWPKITGKEKRAVAVFVPQAPDQLGKEVAVAKASLGRLPLLLSGFQNQFLSNPTAEKGVVKVPCYR